MIDRELPHFTVQVVAAATEPNRKIMFLDIYPIEPERGVVLNLDRAEDAYKLAARLREASDRVVELAKQLPGSAP